MEISSIFLQGLTEWLAFICRSADKRIEGCKMPVQHLHLLYIGGRRHVQECRYLIGVGLDVPLVNQVSQELPESHTKYALLRVEVHLILP